MQRRKPLRSKPLRPAPPLGRKGRKKRTPDEFARIYHSKERVAYVKSWPCCVCGSVPSDNAHTTGFGMGIKAGYETIIPLCRTHHRAYDEHRFPFATEEAREAAKAHAAIVESCWQARSGGPAIATQQQWLAHLGRLR